ncbi:3-oxoacyl-[acyl-carrier protein] reductase [Pseudonocardia hierapolitana]|uniref:3-oxoacyl-[acyl-carrier protein] reductase n=1 Tax=Pseudonocardia hierapolitana TaxID=1128676 RepID=A0A561SZR8_9PSEU|nr:SDR family oxidoreductase [Pseudonocardia hierapolitana]TWF80364.1 3-oxoacyl-[acyl-carrier protein] reductase [Pseudonocardia hierapolitana]
MELSFENKVVVVTGAAGGFGSVTARTFADAGAHVVVSDVDTVGAEKVAADLPSAIAVTTDVTDEDAVRGLVDAAESAFGGIDVMVNNAGVPHRAGALVDLDVETVDRQLAVNVRSVFLGCKHAVPALRRRGGGVIVNVASIAAKRPRPGLTVYNATKGAVITLTRGLAVEVAPDVRVNAVNPVIAETGFVKSFTGADALPDDLRSTWVAGIPMARTATPQDVANSILYLASEQAGFLTGVCLDIDGGRSIQ